MRAIPVQIYFNDRNTDDTDVTDDHWNGPRITLINTKNKGLIRVISVQILFLRKEHR